jgi:hypothetical protein
MNNVCARLVTEGVEVVADAFDVLLYAYESGPDFGDFHPD